MPVGQELQHQVGVRGSALTQVNFDGIMFPSRRLFYRNKVDAEPAQYAFIAQGIGHGFAHFAHFGGIAVAGREFGAQVYLPRFAPQELVVGRDHFRFAQWVNPALHRRRMFNIAFHKGFGNTTHKGQVFQKPLYR